MFIEGNLEASATISSSLTFTFVSGIYVGIMGGLDASGVFSGYISHLRVVKGRALWTSPFIPPSYSGIIRDITPPMTAASVPENWAVTATDNASGSDPFEAFEHTEGALTAGWSATNTTLPKVLQIKLANTLAFNRVDLKSSTDAYCEDNPQDFEIYGSIDGSLYTLLAFFQGVIWSASAETKTFRFENNIAYNYCKINCLAIKPSRSDYYLKLNEVYISREERDNYL